jgi:uncharacterized membrane protein (DUF485 family)
MQEPGYDWEAVEHSDEFQALVHARRRFVIPATVFFLAWYLGFVLLAGYAKNFMGESIYEGFTVGYALALTQFLMVWGLAWAYLRKADRDFEPLEQAAAARAETILAEGTPRTDGGRFERAAETETVEVKR